MAEVAGVIAAIFAALAAIVAALIAARSATRARRANRVDELEDKLAAHERDRHLLYLWNRQLVDHIYTGRPPPPPAPPAGLFTD